MADIIDVNPGAFLTEARKLSEALEPFRSYATASSQNYLSSVGGFNSDFIEALKKVLNHINDDAGPGLLASIEDYQRKITAVADKLIEADEGLAAAIKGGS